jgi:O-antigen/teichoic acid export membrane protein
MRKIVTRFRKSEFLTNVFTLISATSIAQAIALAIYPVLSRIYTPAEHGLFALYMGLISFLSIISTGKYELAIMISKKDREGLDLLYISVILSFLFSVFLLVIVMLFNKQIPAWLGNPEIGRWLFFIPLSTFMIGVFQSLSYWNNRLKKYRSIASANLGQSIVNSGVKITTSNAIRTGGGLITGAISGQFTGLMIYLFGFFRRNGSSLHKPELSRLKKVAARYNFFPRYNLPHYLTNNLSSSLPVFVFSSWFTATQVGWYSLAFMMINRPMNLITNSLSQVFSQRVIQKFNGGEKVSSEVRALIIRLALISVLPLVLVGLFGPAIFGFVFGDDWYEAGRYMRLLLPWLFVVFISSPLSFLPDMLSLQKKAMWIDLVKFLLRIVALAIGVIMNNIYWAITLFSLISFILVSYSLIWYVNLSALADEKSIKNKPDQT